MKTTKTLASLMLMSIVAAMMTMVLFTSCSDEDDLSIQSNPIARQVIGSWYTEYDTQGTVSGFMSDDPEQTYTSAVQYYEFHNDGTGLWTKFLYDAADNAIYQYGSMTGFNPEGEFTYIVSADGTIHINMTHDMTDTPKQWTVRFFDGNIMARDGSEDFTMRHATDEEIAYVKSEDGAFHGGAIKNKDYNINEDPMMSEDMETTFNAKNWWQHTHIYIYVGGSDYNQDIYDVNGKQKIGYDEVALPWNKEEANTHLPMRFLDNFTPESGWQLVMNRCGSNNIVNNNFMAFYNKYTGILRFFYYVPDKFGVSASDHAWEVMLSDNLAKHSTLRYGVPSSVQLNKSAIGQNNSGYYSQVITPWANSFNELGGAVLNSGWWAFDVDMSQYRPNASDNFDINNDRVQLQLKAWQKSRVDLYGKMKADIGGEFKMPVSGNSASGIWGAFGEHLETGEKIYNSIQDFAGELLKQDYWGAFKKGMDMFELGANLCGYKGEDGKKNGQINLTMDGSIDMSGTISTPVSAKGLCSPVMSLKLFDTNNTTLGQGVWNIKKNPVVCVTNAYVVWYNTGNVKSYGFSDTPQGKISFFDPSSIEVELNPKVFPKNDIEKVTVDAVCGVRSSVKVGENDDFRMALGIGNHIIDGHRSNRNLLSDSCKDPWNRTFDATNWIYDFLRGVEDKGDTNIASLYKGQSGKIMLGALGRGHNGYILEPQTANPMGYNKDLKADFDNDHMAPYEVTVTVTIKLKSMANPIVMSRVYLPEFEWVDVNTPSNMASLYNRIKNGKKSNSTELYDYQVKRIGEILKWINPKFNY